jgi:energy-converting hydrogenase Eha subunit C
VNKNISYKAFSYLGIIFLSNFILKAVRDLLVVTYLLENIQWLFTVSFCITMLLVPTVGIVLNKFRIDKFIKSIHLIYGLFLIVISQYLEIALPSQIAVILFIVTSNFFNLLFIIAIAWINYINLATATSLERSKDVGIIKILGSGNDSLKTQFLVSRY